MALRLRFCALLFAGLAAAAGASDQPPSSLHLVGGHWTAWNPPATTSPDAKIHIVQKGDTFWALAGQHLGNSYLWPQIWEKNQWVLDAHWIYPGDPLVVGVEVAPAGAVGAVSGMPTEEVAGSPSSGTATGAGSGAAAAGAGGEAAEVSPHADSALARANTPVPLGSESDIYCSGYIGDPDQSFEWSVNGSEYEALTPQLSSVNAWAAAKGLYGSGYTVKFDLSFGDIVYIDGGRSSGLAPGMQLMAVAPEEKVRHPVTGDVVGRFYGYLGRLRVLTVLEDRSIAEIVQGCVGMRVGAKLMPFQPEPVPLARPPIPRPVNAVPASDLTTGPTIVRSEANIFSMGADSLVWIDRGDQDDVAPGDIYTVFRPSPEGNPAVPIGELAILSVKEHSSLAKIVETRYPVYVGDRLERR